MRLQILRFIGFDFLSRNQCDMRKFKFYAFLLLFSIVSVPAIGQITITQTPTIICDNTDADGDPIKLSLLASGKPDATFANGGSYHWYTVPTGGNPIHTGNTLDVNDKYEVPTYAVTFYVEYEDNLGKKSTTRKPYTINFKGGQAYIKQGQKIAFCGKSELILEAKEIPGATYQWYKYKSGGIFGGFRKISGATNSTYKLNSTDAGSYTVRVTANGCTSTALVVEVAEQIQGIEIDNAVNGKIQFCGGDNLVLSGKEPVGDYSYRWQIRNLNTGVITWSSPSPTSYYAITSADKAGAGISKNSVAPQFEYRLAITTYTVDAGGNKIELCKDVLSQNPITLDKIALPKGEIKEINDGFTTISVCPQTNETGVVASGSSTFINGIEFTGLPGVKYIWYRSATSNGAGTQVGLGTKHEVKQTGYYYVQLDNGTCKGEASKRIFVKKLDYNPPFITVDGQTVDKNTPKAYLCAGQSSIILRSNFEVPSGQNASDFVYQWYQEVRAGKLTPELKPITGATGSSYVVSETDLSASSDGKYQITVRHKDCPANMIVRSKPILIKKLDINIEGTHTKSNGNNVSIPLGKNNLVQLCPGDTYTLQAVQSSGLQSDFSLSTTWSSAPISADGSLPHITAFTNSSAPSASMEGHFQAMVDIPGYCKVIAFVTIRKKTAEVKGADGGFCKGEKITLEVQGGPFNTYSWKYSIDGIKPYNEVATTPSYKTGKEGFYKVIVRDSDCDFESKPFEIKETLPPTVNASVDGFPINNKVLYCDNAKLPTIDIVLDPVASSNVKYTWKLYDKDDNFITVKAFNVTNPSLQVSENISTSQPAKYVLEVKAGGCDVQDTFLVDKIDRIEFISTSPENPSSQTLCPGSAITPIKGGYEYTSPNFKFQWQKQNTAGNWVDYTGPTADNGRKANLTSTDAGIYRLRVYGCDPEKEGFSKEIIVIAPPNVHNPVAINNDLSITKVTYCGDEGRVTLSAPSGLGYKVAWYHQKKGETKFNKIGIGSSIAVGGVSSGLATHDGVYYAKVSFNKVCVEETQRVTVEKATKIPDITITADPKGFECTGLTNLSTNLSKDVRVAQQYNFLWEVYTRAGKQNPRYVQVGTEPVLPNVSNSTGNQFRVTVTSKLPGCSDPKKATITISKDSNLPLEMYISPKTKKSETSITACSNVILSPNNPYKNLGATNYLWTLPNGSQVVNEQLAAAKAGKYILKVTTDKGCILTDEVTVSLNVPTKPNLDKPNPRALCPGGKVKLTVVNQSVGGSYTWKKDNGSGTFVADNSLGNNPSALVAKGKYVVSYVAKNCAEMTSNPIEVTAPNALNVSVRNSVELCKNGFPVTVKANKINADSTALTYLWEKQNGSTFQPAPSTSRISTTYTFSHAEIAGGTNATQGVYRLKVTYGGCSFYSNLITVKIVNSYDPNNKLQITESAPTVCGSGKATLSLNGHEGTEGIVWESFIRAGKQDPKWIALTDAQNKTTAQVVAGKYRVSQTGECGVKKSNDINVAAPSIKEVKIIQAEALKANGKTIFKYCGSTDLQVKNATTFSSGVRFEWYYAQNASSSSAKIGSGSKYTLTNTSRDGIYTVKAIVGSCELEALIQVEQTNKYDRLEFSAKEYTLCKDGTVNLSVSYPSRPTSATQPTYQWRYTEGATPATFNNAKLISGATGSTHVFKPADPSKTHYIYVKATSSDCGVVDAFVKVNPPVPNTVTYAINEDNGTKLEFCSGSTFQLTAPNYGTGYVYVWKRKNGSGTFAKVTSNASPIPNKLITDVPGIYKLAVSPSAGCVPVDTDTVNVHAVQAISGATTSNKPQQFCTDLSEFTLKPPVAISSSITGYTWFKSQNKTINGTYSQVANTQNYKIQIDKSANIQSQVSDKSGWYRVDVVYTCGKRSYFTEVEISTPPSSESVALNVKDPSIKYCVLGAGAQGITLKPSTPETGGSLIYQWQKSEDGGTTYVDIPAAENGQQTNFKAKDLDGDMDNETGTFYRLKAIATGCETLSKPVQVIGTKKGSEKPVLTNSGNLELCYAADGSKEFTLSVQKVPSDYYDYQWVKYTDATNYQVVATGKGLIEFTAKEAGKYAVGLKTDCDNALILSDIVQIKDVPEDSRVPEILELKARSGEKEIKYCKADGVTLNLDNPNKSYDYIWVKKDANGQFATVTAQTPGAKVNPQDNQGNVQLVVDNTSTGGIYAVYLKRKSCPALLETERSLEVTLTPVDDISTIVPKPKVKVKGKSDINATIHRLCSVGEKATLIATLGEYNYQWQKKDDAGTFQDISGANSKEYLTSEAGIYRVRIISSGCGELNSEQLQILTPSSAQEAPAIEFEQGNEAPFCAQSPIKSTQISLKLDNMKEDQISITWEKSADNKTYEKISVSGLKYTATEGYYRATALFEGCEVSVQKPVHVFPSNEPPKPKVATESPAFFCADGYATIRAASVSGSDSLRWLYSKEKNGIYQVASFTTANKPKLKTRVAGFYKLHITSQGCGEGQSEKPIEVIGTSEEPVAEIVQGAKAKYCPGGDVVLDVKAQDVYNYQWYYKENIKDDYKELSGFFSRTNAFRASKDGYYRVKVYFNGCEAISDSIHVTESSEGLPIPEVINGTKQAFCSGQGISLETTLKGAGYYYQWSRSKTKEGSYQDISVNTIKYFATESGFYKITVGKKGCGESDAIIEVYEISNDPEAVILQEPLVQICKSNPTILEASTQEKGFRYEWRRYASKTILKSYKVVKGMKNAPYNLETNVPSFYRLSVSNQGCASLSDPVQVVSVEELSTPEILQAPLTGFCPGESVTLEAKEKSTFSTYTWKYSATRNGNFETVLTGRGVDFRAYSTNVAGFYKLEVSQPSCTAKESAVMQVQGVNEPPEAVINEGETETQVCKGKTIELEAKTVPNATYHWSGPEGFTAKGRKVSVQALSLENAGQYKLTTSILGCATTADLNLKVNDLPKFTLVPPNVICTGDETGIIELQSEDETLTYRLGENGEFSDQKVFDGLSAGTYQVFVKNTSGCEVLQNVKIEESDQLGVTLTTQDVTINKGDSVQLNVSGAKNYLWKPEKPEDFLSKLTDAKPWVRPLQTTTYTVKGNSPEGCGISQVTVTVKVNYNIKPNNVITPNNDGVNDTWITNLKWAYPNAVIHVYDSWGIEVYTFKSSSSNPYEDDWGATDKNGATLATGAYSYVIEPNYDGDAELNKPIFGVVTVVNE